LAGESSNKKDNKIEKMAAREIGKVDIKLYQHMKG